MTFRKRVQLSFNNHIINKLQDCRGKFYETTRLKALNEENWEMLVSAELKRLKKSESDLAQDLKGTVWKTGIAKLLRKQTPSQSVTATLSSAC